MLLILLLHALVTTLLPPLNGLLVHIFRSAPRLPAYKRVNRFWPLTTLPTKYKCVFSSLHAFFHFFCGIYLSYFQSVASICRSIWFCDIYLSYFKLWHIYVGILFSWHIFVVLQSMAYIRKIWKNVIYMTKAKHSLTKHSASRYNRILLLLIYFSKKIRCQILTSYFCFFIY